MTDKDILRFITDEDKYNKLPKPSSAASILPSWYKNIDGDLSSIETEVDKATRTVRRCAPFLDAMSSGWIIKIPCDILWSRREDGTIAFDWDASFTPVIKHPPSQLGPDFSDTQTTIVKFLGKWYVNAPEEYSLLYTHPLNRRPDRFKAFSGIIDAKSHIPTTNAPSLWIDSSNDEGLIEKGTPFLHIIPIKRKSLDLIAETDTATDDEAMKTIKQQANKSKNPSVYREEKWEPKATKVKQSKCND